SPDGSTVVTVTSVARDRKSILFTDTATGRRLRTLDLANMPGDDVQFTPDGKQLAFIGSRGIKLVDGMNGKTARVFDAWAANSPVIAFSADGNRLAAQLKKFGSDTPITIWDTKTGKEVASIPCRSMLCKGLALGPEGKRLLVWTVASN